MIYYKSSDEIEIMAEGGKVLTEIARKLRSMIEPGINTKSIDSRAIELFEKNNMKPAFLNYGTPPYPAAVCISINEEVVHGIPSDERIIESGDIVSIDLGGHHRGFCTDMAFTEPAGKISDKAKKLIKTTRESLEAGIEKFVLGNRLHDISAAIQSKAEKMGYNVVRDMVGHGIGKELHESPQVPNYGEPGTGLKLKKGLTLAIEPMLNIGTYSIVTGEDKWTVSTADGELSAHWEKTVALTEDGPRIIAGI